MRNAESVKIMIGIKGENMSNFSDYKEYWSWYPDIFMEHFLGIELLPHQRMLARFVGRFKRKYAEEIKLDESHSIIFGRRGRMYLVYVDENGEKKII